MSDSTTLNRGIVVVTGTHDLFVTAAGKALEKEVAYSRFLQDLGVKPPADPGIYEWTGRIDFSGCHEPDDEPTFAGEFRRIGTIAELDAWVRSKPAA